MSLKIRLVDVDGHNFPNLALMKLSAYHKQKDDTVEMAIPLKKYDIIYKSKVFTFTPDIDYKLQANLIAHGGTGYDIEMQLPSEIEMQMPDYSLYPQFDEAYGFLSRGCPRCCGFCIVSKKEGYLSHKVANLSDFYKWQKVIKLLDPNILACSDREDLLFQLANSKAYIDFTQGLDARLIDKDLIGLLNKINTKMIHFAWDNPNEDLIPYFQLFNKHTKLKSYRTKSVYVLVNYNSMHEQDLERVERLKELNYNPYIMIYDKENAPPYTKQLARFVNNRRIFRSVDKFEDYIATTKK